MYHQGSLCYQRQNVNPLLLENFHYNQQMQDHK
nr:MAG TPA: hypothetical protein [Crassvirales sp.]